jgi:hypothetical protein
MQEQDRDHYILWLMTAFIAWYWAGIFLKSADDISQMLALWQ